MTTPAVTPTQPDPFAEFGGASTGNATPQAAPAQPAAQPTQPTQSDPFAEFGGVKVEPDTKETTDPRKTGEIINDVGQKVIVPKDGESFSDTMKRAVAYHKSLTPEQQQAALDAEAKTAPKKAAETLGAAATIGAVGPAVLAAPGEIAQALPSVLMHTTEGVKAFGVWASAHPIQAYMLYQVVKDLIPGAKKAMGLIKALPEVMP
jgi:3-phosphoglycerate kinase